MMSFIVGRFVVGVCEETPKVVFPSVVNRTSLGCTCVLRKDTCACNIVISIAMYIDKLEIAFYLCSHPLRVARELLSDILLERGSSPASHFLNLGV